MSEPPLLLVVDDNEDNRFTLTHRLQRLGPVRVVEAADGLAALDRLREQSFDLVLLDVMMPILDGIETLRIIKTDLHLRHIPVIMLSAATELERVARCIELGAEDYLPKPFDKTILRARVMASLERKRLRDRERALLRALLPAAAVDELEATGTVTPRRFEDVAVLYADLVGFTAWCDLHAPEAVVAEMAQLLAQWERILPRHGMETIDTIGDALLATANLLVPQPEPVVAALACARALVDAAASTPSRWALRVGIHIGPVVAGVAGHERPSFDIWGDTVNTAARLAGIGHHAAIFLSTAARAGIGPQRETLVCEEVELKGKGQVQAWRLDVRPCPGALRC